MSLNSERQKEENRQVADKELSENWYTTLGRRSWGPAIFSLHTFLLFLSIAISMPNNYLALYTYRVFIPTLLYFETLEYCYYVKIKNCEFRVKWFSCYHLAGEWQRQDLNPDSSTQSHEGVGDTAWKGSPRIICIAISKYGNKCVSAKDDGFQVRWTRVYTLPLSLWPWANHLIPWDLSFFAGGKIPFPGIISLQEGISNGIKFWTSFLSLPSFWWSRESHLTDGFRRNWACVASPSLFLPLEDLLI